MKWTKFTLLFLFLCFTSAGSDTLVKSSKIRLLPTKPVNAGTVNKESALWATSVIDQLVRFRLEPLTEINTVTEKELSTSIPEILDMSAVIGEERYSAAAKMTNATHLLTQKFEISQSKKVINYYIEVCSTHGKNPILNLERDIPFDHFASGIDSCLITMLDQLEIKLGEQSVRFFQIPVLSDNFKNIKQLGEVIMRHRSKENPGDAVVAREYEKLIEKDPLLLLANYTCGLTCFRAEKYDKAATYLKQLLDVAPVHSELFFTLAQSYRLSGRYNEALRVVINSEKMRLGSIPFLLEKALDFEGLGNRGTAMSVYLQILRFKPDHTQSLLFMARQKNSEAKYKEALVYIKRLIKVAPENGNARLEQGRTLFALKYYDESLKPLNSAAELLPDNPQPEELLGDLYLKKLNYAEAVTHLKKALNFQRNDLDLYLKTAKALEMNKSASEALSLLRGVAPRLQKAHNFTGQSECLNLLPVILIRPSEPE